MRALLIFVLLLGCKRSVSFEQPANGELQEQLGLECPEGMILVMAKHAGWICVVPPKKREPRPGRP